MAEPPRRRRIDRVTDPAFLDDLEQRSATDVRTMRDECREEESRLSYARRVVQGQIDIARAEVNRRGGSTSEDLVESLARILADSPSTQRRDPRALSLYDPTEERGRRSEDFLMASGAGSALGRLPDLDEEELVALIEDLTARERGISAQRRIVLDNLDRLQDELVERYREGRAGVGEVVSSEEDDD